MDCSLVCIAFYVSVIYDIDPYVLVYQFPEKQAGTPSFANAGTAAVPPTRPPLSPFVIDAQDEPVNDFFSDEWQAFFRSEAYMAWYDRALASGVCSLCSLVPISF